MFKTSSKMLVVGAAGALLSVGLLAGCSASSKASYTYDVSTGDQIEVSMDMTRGYGLNQDGFITKNGDAIGKIQWMTEADFANRCKGASALESYKHVEYKGNEGVYHELPDDKGGTQYIYALWVNGSNTGIVVMTITNEQDASSALNALDFRKAN